MHLLAIRISSLQAAAPLARSTQEAAPAPTAATPSCAPRLLDQATGQCLSASSLPGMGQLLPLSLDFNVQPSGDVGIGTATPADELHVEGVVRAQGGSRFADGSLQTTAGTKDWNEPQNAPPGFADGVANDTPTAAGTGLLLSGNRLSIAGLGEAAAQLANDSASLSKVSAENLTLGSFANVPLRDLLVGAATARFLCCLLGDIEVLGAIAQEVEEVFPDWVGRRGDGYRSVTFRGFEAVAIEALRELRLEKDAGIATLEARLARLAGRLSELEGR